jgi:hypothetical protein
MLVSVTVDLTIWMTCISYNMDDLYIIQYGWLVYHTIWMACISYNMDGLYIIQYGWLVYHTIWMACISYNMDDLYIMFYNYCLESVIKLYNYFIAIDRECNCATTKIMDVCR